MKISKVVETLNAMKEKIGDIEVDVFTSDGLLLEITDIRYINKADVGEFVFILSEVLKVENADEH